MQANQDQQHTFLPIRLNVGIATVDDVKQALCLGLNDFRKRPGLGIFFGLVYALFGIILVFGLLFLDQVWFLIVVGVGFPLVAPFLAAGLYEISRRLQRAEAFRASDIFLVIFNQ